MVEKVDNRRVTVKSEAQRLNTALRATNYALGTAKGDSRTAILKNRMVLVEQLGILNKLDPINARGLQIAAAYKRAETERLQHEAEQAEQVADAAAFRAQISAELGWVAA